MVKETFILVITMMFCSPAISQIDNKESLRDSEMHKKSGFIGIYTGSMIPYQANTRLGFHPLLGIDLGSRINRFSYCLIAEGRFLDTRRNYTIYNKDKDTLLVTNEYLGALIGIEAGYRFLGKNDWSADVIAGGGYEIARTILYPENYTDDVTINTYNFHIGAGISRIINSKTYFYLAIKYNFVDYTLSNQSDLTENYFSVTLHLRYNAVKGITTSKTGP